MQKRLLVFVWMVLACAALVAQPLTQKQKREKESLPLDGIWSFKLDPLNISIPVKGSNFTQRLPEEITLPGSLDQAGKGFKTQDMTSIRLTRLFEYSGAAWYEKTNVFVPENWQGKEVCVFLERAHWETQIWVNGKFVGKDESLSTPHIYNITPYVVFGKKNTIRLKVDNGPIHKIDYTHAISAETQTNWNGVIGEMKLQAFDKVYVKDMQLYPDRKQKKVKVVAEISNSGKQKVSGVLTLNCGSINSSKSMTLAERKFEFAGQDSLFTVEFEYGLGENVLLWDEFTPNLYKLDVAMSATDGKQTYADSMSEEFGVRDFGINGTQFTINDRPTFVRGTVNSCEFPITGYPPMDYKEWFRVLSVCKDYGMNCIRFHSWCPPKAAFEAADRLGLYLQIENSDWRFTVGTNQATDDFYFSEAKRIFSEYGNHPSFIFFCEGNELVGPGCTDFLKKMLVQWTKDPRHLYVAASGYPTIEGSDFYEFYGARPQRWQEGLKGRFNAQPLNTIYTYSNYVSKFKIPMITHEIGQWCVYPDFKQIPKYVGVLKPYNYELFREGLRDANMLDQADDFHMASGKFQVIQKKEEFESYFRTPGFGGYHLLQINDFPGQGTSPVGVVDVFYDSKPYVTADEFRRMQSPVMPLMRTDKFTWTNNETFVAAAECVNFGAKDIRNSRVVWTLKYPDGRLYARGALKTVDIPLGPITSLGKVSVPLNKITEATSLELTFALENTDVFNKWSIWVYPQQLPTVDMGDVLVTRTWNQQAKDVLDKGGKVMLMASPDAIDSDVPPGFSGISWNAVWSGTPPNLLGILCNPQHPALAEFPTEYHSNWQWFDMVRHSRPMLLNNTPTELKPVVQMIPDWNNNRKIGLIFEAKVGNGKLLMTSIDLDAIKDKSPVARQMLYSLQRYVAGEGFAPEVAVDVKVVDKQFK